MLRTAYICMCSYALHLQSFMLEPFTRVRYFPVFLCIAVDGQLSYLEFDTSTKAWLFVPD